MDKNFDLTISFIYHINSHMFSIDSLLFIFFYFISIVHISIFYCSKPIVQRQQLHFSFYTFYPSSIYHCIYCTQ